MSDLDLKIRITAENDIAIKSLRDLSSELGKLSDTNIDVGLNIGSALSDISGISSELSKLSDTSINVDLNVGNVSDLSDLASGLRDLESGSPYKIEVDLETNGALLEIQGLIDELRRLKDELGDGGGGGGGGGIAGLVAGLGGIAAAGAAIAVIGSAAIDAEKGVAQLAAQLGVTRDEAQQFADIGQSIYQGAWGESLEEVNTSLAAVSKGLISIGETSGSAIQEATQNAMTLGSVYGDTEKQIQAAITLQKNFGISSQEAFDMLAGGFQRGLDGSGDFLDSILEYSNQFSQGGASASEFFSVMDSGMASGVLGVDKAADMFKEFQVRILDGSKSTSEALAQIGLTSDEMTKKINSGQMSVADAFNLVHGKLRDVDDQAVLMQAGVGLLGTQFEDLGSTLALSVDTAKVSMNDLIGSMDAANATNTTLTVAATEAWRTLIGTFANSEAASSAISGLTELLLGFTNFVKNLPDIATIAFANVASGFAVIPTVFETGLSGVKSVFASAFQFLLQKVSDFVGSIGSMVSTIGEYVPGVDGLGASLNSLSGSIANVGNKVGGMVSADFTSALEKNRAGIDSWRDSMLEGNKSFKAMNDEIKISTPAAKRLAEETKKTGEAVKALEPAGKAARKGIGEAEKAAKQAANELKRLEDQIDKTFADLQFETATVGMDKISTDAEKLRITMEKAGWSEQQIKDSLDYYETQKRLNEEVENKLKLDKQLAESSEKKLQDLQNEIELLGITDEKERARLKAVQDIHPEMQSQYEELLKQKNAIQEQNQIWKEQQEIVGNIGDLFLDFLGNIGKGSSALQSLGSGLTGMFNKNLSQQRANIAAGKPATTSLDSMSAVDMLKGASGFLGEGLTSSLGGLASGVDSLAVAVGGMGNLLGGAGAAFSLLSGDLKGGLGGIGGLAGSFFGGPIGGMIGSQLGSLLAGAFGGETRSGGAYRVGGGGQFSKIQGPSGGDISLDATQSAMQETVRLTNELLAGLGSTARVADFTGANESSENGKGGWWAGGKLSTGAAFGEQFTGQNVFEDKGSYTNEEAMAGFALDLEQSIVQALQAVGDSPEWVQNLLSGIDAESLSSEQVGVLLANIQAMDKAIAALENYGIATENVTQSMIDGAGGIDSLVSATESYYANFYNETERGQQALEQFGAQINAAFDELGLAVPPTKNAFRELVDGLDTTTDEGQKLFGTLMSISPAFSEFIALQNEFSESIKSSSDGMKSMLSGDGAEVLLGDVFADAKKQAASYDQAQSAAYQAHLRELNPAAFEAASGLDALNDSAQSLAYNSINNSQSLLDYVRGLTFGADSTLTGEEQYARSEQSFLQALQSGDQSQILEAAKQFREISKEQLGESQDFADVDKFIRESLTGIAEKQLGRGAVDAALGSGAVSSAPDQQILATRIAELEQQLIAQQAATVEAQNITNRLLADIRTDSNRNAQQQVAATQQTGQQTSLAVERAAVAGMAG